MKSFCILEQGNSIDDPLTIKKKKLFTTDFSDFYRLNWQNKDDPNAFITQDNIVWSEGRSLLYEKVPKNYEYYIITDDDIDFSCIDNTNVALKIKELLDDYKPITGTFFDPIRWHFKWTGIDPKVCLSRKAFPIAGYDEQVQILSKSFADVIFPIIYHGGGNATVYSQWACYKLFPFKQVCFSEIQISDTRHAPHLNRTKPQHAWPKELSWLFNTHVKDRDFKMPEEEMKSQQVANNIAIFNHSVDRENIEFTLSDFAKIYNIKNPDFKNRKSKADDSYIRKINWRRRRRSRRKKIMSILLRFQKPG